MTKRSSRFSFKRAATALLLPFAAALPVSADIPADSVRSDTTVIADTAQVAAPVDTLLFAPPDNVTVAGDVTNAVNLEARLHQRPTVALFKSMVVPGLGQLGNRSYFKAVLFAGLETWFIGSAIHYGRQADDARAEWQNAVVRSNQIDWYYLYDNKRRNRNKFAWFAGLTIFISMFDAYVDAHLSGSPADKRNNRFSVDVIPSDAGGVAALLSYRF